MAVRSRPHARGRRSGEDSVAGLDGVEQMEAGDRAAGAVGLAIFVRDDQRGLTGAVDHARGEDADDAAMPAVAVDDDADRDDRGISCSMRVDLGEHRIFGGAAFGVEPVELLSRARARGRRRVW